MTAIFTTIHGSRLYGLDHAGSDHDTYTVFTDSHQFGEGERGQRVRGFADRVQDDISIHAREFLKRVENGSHQALEALFSPVKQYSEEGEKWKRFFESMYVGSQAFPAYERTIRKFAFQDFKRRRHAVRLSQNLEAMRALGRFNPKMSVAQIQAANEMATTLSGNALIRELDIPVSTNYSEDITNEKEKA